MYTSIALCEQYLHREMDNRLGDAKGCTGHTCGNLVVMGPFFDGADLQTMIARNFGASMCCQSESGRMSADVSLVCVVKLVEPNCM